MNVVIYARFSSHSQTEQSIEGQLKVCSATSVISASIFTKERKHPAGCLAFWMMTYFTGCNR